MNGLADPASSLLHDSGRADRLSKAMISHEYRFVFVDICKTAGTSLGSALRKYGGRGKHHAIARPLPQIRENRGLQPYISDYEKQHYFKFTFVRNPWDRAVSLFSYCQDAPLQKRFATNGWSGIMKASKGRLPNRARDRVSYWPNEFPTFLRWVAEYQEYFVDFELEKYIPMLDWLKDRDGQAKIDFLGRYENLAEDFRLICDVLRLPHTPLPRLMTSANRRSGTYRDAFDSQTKKLVEHIFHDDIEEFDYEF